MTSAHHLDACNSPRNVRETGAQPTTPGAPANPAQPITPARRYLLRLTVVRAMSVALAVLLPITPMKARAVDCAPADRECRLAVAVIRLDADLAVEQARTDRLTRELAACRAMQGACPALPRPDPYPWRDVVTAGAVGVAVGVVAWAVVSLALAR